MIETREGNGGYMKDLFSGRINKTYIERFHALVNEKGDPFSDI